MNDQFSQFESGHFDLSVLTPDPSALRDVFQAHQRYDAPSEPIVLSNMTAQMGYGSNDPK